jgi:hypothetical protein
MKNSPFILLMFLSFFTGNLYAQSLSPQEIRRVFPDTIEGGISPGQIISHSDGGFLVAGAMEQQGFIAKLNGCGDPLWVKLHQLGDETALNGIVEMPSGELFAVGSCLNCAPGDTTRKALALVTDASGEALRDTTFGRLNFNASATAVIRTADGKAAVTGHFVWASFLGPTRAFLTTLDEQLQSDLWKEYNELYYDTPLALAQISDGGFVLAGYSVASLASSRQAQLFRTDAQGELLWKNTSPHQSSQFNSVQESADGKIVALGHRYVDDVNNRDAFLAAHQSAGGNSLLERVYGSPADDEGRSLHVVEGGYLAGGVWGEPSQPNWGKRDWVFRLDENYNKVEDNFHDSYLHSHSLVNVVPLSPDGWNFGYLSSAAFFSSRFILFYKKTYQGRHAVLSNAPRHYQLVPRNTATNMGTVAYQGEMETSGTYDEMRLKVFRNDALVQTLYNATPQDFSFSVNIPAELADYSFRLTGVKNGVEYPEAEACDVVAGDAYIIQGQSNALAGTPIWDLEDTIPHAYRYHRNPYVRNFGLKHADGDVYGWHKEADDDNYYNSNHRSGQWGLVLGEKIVQEQSIPVAIINGGIGGISIDNMLPDLVDPHSEAHSYGRFFQRVENSGLSDFIRAVIFFQGETNALPGYNETVNSYKNKYLQLRNHWQSDFGYEREYLFQIRPGCWDGNFHIIQEAHRQLALEIPDSDIMSSTGMNHDGCHYHYDNGYERAGNDVYRLLAKDFYEASPMPNVHPPTVDSAWFSQCDRREITLQLSHAEDDYSWTPGWETDFRIEGSADVVVQSGVVAGNTVVLSLSAAPGPEFSGLSYVSHTHGDEAPVKNANGIGMLCFYDFPVEDPAPAVDSVSYAICPGESYALPDGMLVDEPGTYTTSVTTPEGCLHLVVTELEVFEELYVEEVDVTSDDGSGNGSLSAVIGGGVPPYQYFWSNGGTTSSITGLASGDYTLTVTDAALCENEFYFTVPLMTSIKEFDAFSGVKVFPNPFGDVLQVDLSGAAAEGCELALLDSRGRELRRLQSAGANALWIPTFDLPAGLYLLVVQQQNMIRSFKVIKE